MLACDYGKKGDSQFRFFEKIKMKITNQRTVGTNTHGFEQPQRTGSFMAGYLI